MNLLKKSLLNCCGGTAAESQHPRTPVEIPKRTVPDDSASFQQLKRIMEELKTYNDSVKALNGKIDALQNHSSITVLSTSSGNSKANNHPSTDVGISKSAVIDNSASSEQFQLIKNELQQYNASLKALNDKMGVLKTQNVLNNATSVEPSQSERDIVPLDRPVVDDSASSGQLKLILDELQKYHVSLKSFHEKGGGVADHSVQYEFSKIPKYDNLSNVKMACLQIKKFILSNRHEADLMDKGDDIIIIINVIYQILSGEWYDHLKKNVKEETPEEDLCTCLKAVAEAALSLGDNNDLLWLIIPIHRLLFELLQCLSSTVAKTGIIKDKGQQPKDEKDVQMDREHLAKLMLRLSPVIENINSLPEITVSCRLTKTITSSLEKLFVEHLKDCAAAIGNVVVGLVKSFLNRNVDPTLMKGIQQIGKAAFDIYLHIEAEKQINLVQTFVPSRPLDQALISYEELRRVSTAFQESKGNWLSTSTYINNLLKIVFCAYQGLSPSSIKEDIHERMKIINACIHHNQAGIVKLYGQYTRKRRCSSSSPKLLFSILDGSTFSEILKNATIEALGEINEITTACTDKSIHALIDSLDKLKNLEQDLENKLLSEETVSEIVSEIVSKLKWFEEIRIRFEKGFQRLKESFYGIKKLLHVVDKYLLIFEDQSDNTDYNKAELSETIFRKLNDEKANDEFVRTVWTKVTGVGHNSRDVLQMKQLLHVLKDYSEELEEQLIKANAVFVKPKGSSSPTVNLWESMDKDILKLERFYQRKMGKDNAKRDVGGVEPFKEADINGWKENIERVKKNFASNEPSETSLLQKLSNMFMIIVDFADHVCEKFDEVADNLPKFEKELTDLTGEARKKLTALFKCDNVQGWWKTVSQAVSVCSFNTNVIGSAFNMVSDAGISMNLLRDSLVTLVGPGARPDLVEETILSTILELETILSGGRDIDTTDQNITSTTVTTSKTTPLDTDEERNRMISTGLSKAIECLKRIIAKSKATTSNRNIKSLLKQASYRTKVIKIFASSWHSIETEVLAQHEITKETHTNFQQLSTELKGNGIMQQMLRVENNQEEKEICDETKTNEIPNEQKEISEKKKDIGARKQSIRSNNIKGTDSEKKKPILNEINETSENQDDKKNDNENKKKTKANKNYASGFIEFARKIIQNDFGKQSIQTLQESIQEVSLSEPLVSGLSGVLLNISFDLARTEEELIVSENVILMKLQETENIIKQSDPFYGQSKDYTGNFEELSDKITNLETKIDALVPSQNNSTGSKNGNNSNNSSNSNKNSNQNTSPMSSSQERDISDRLTAMEKNIALLLAQQQIRPISPLAPRRSTPSPRTERFNFNNLPSPAGTFGNASRFSTVEEDVSRVLFTVYFIFIMCSFSY
jgi:hypothetical protein